MPATLRGRKFALLLSPFAPVGVLATSMLSSPAVTASTDATSSAAAGLALFRKSGRDGQSCAGCHSPDGIEIGAFGFAKSDVVRRASNHLDQRDANDVAAFLQSNRAARHPLHPDSTRPLQPGGALLAGETAAARDAAFGRELAKLVPELDGAPVRSMATAMRVRDRFLRIDPRVVKVGIPFNHLSEDGFHGPLHATMADWIPDVPIGLTPQLIALQDDYLAQPDSEHLAKLDSAVAKITSQSAIHQLAILKYRSLLLLQHAIRVGGPSAARLDRIQLIGHGNPFWEVAEFANHNSLGDPKALSLPDTLLAKKHTVPMNEQMAQLRLPWYWTAWAVDPTLATIDLGLSRTAVRGDYFTRFLWSDGPYPIHMAFMLTKKLVQAGYGPILHSDGRPRHYEIQFSNFLLGDRLLATDAGWHENRNQVFKVAGNAFRTSLFLLEEDLQRTHGSVRPESQLGQIAAMRRFFDAGNGDAADTELCDRVSQELRAAHVDYRR